MSDFEFNVIKSGKVLESEDESGTFKVPQKTVKKRGASQHTKRDANSIRPLSSDEDLVEDHASKSKKIKPKAVKKQRPRQATPVSDDDLEEEPASKSKKIKPKAVKKQRTRQATPVSDEDLEEEPANKSKKIEPEAVKKQRARQATPELNPGWFSNWGDDEDIEAQRRASSLTSVLTRRVPGGYVRRSASLTGDLFIELKLFNVDDIQNIPSQDRWEKALINFKYRVDSNSAVVDAINKVLKLCKDDFTEEGTFFQDKTKK